MKRRLVPALLVVGTAAWAGFPALASESWTLTRAEWAGVQSASQVIAIGPVREAVTALAADPGSLLAVVHNGGEDGVFWASDLEGWLISLGVPAARIEDRAGAVVPGKLRLELESPGGEPPP